MAETESLVRHEESYDGLEKADFSYRNYHVSIQYRENEFHFEWMTGSDFYEVAESINQEYPITEKLDVIRSPDRYRSDHFQEHVKNLENASRYDHIRIPFRDMEITWSNNHSERRINEPHLVRLNSEGAGIWPFEHLYSHTSGLDERESSEIIRDIESFFGF